MKKLFYIFAILISAAVLTSCDKEKVVAEEDVIVESAVDTLCAAPADTLCAAPADTLVVE